MKCIFVMLCLVEEMPFMLLNEERESMCRQLESLYCEATELFKQEKTLSGISRQSEEKRLASVSVRK